VTRTQGRRLFPVQRERERPLQGRESTTAPRHHAPPLPTDTHSADGVGAGRGAGAGAGTKRMGTGSALAALAGAARTPDAAQTNAARGGDHAPHTMVTQITGHTHTRTHMYTGIQFQNTRSISPSHPHTPTQYIHPHTRTRTLPHTHANMYTHTHTRLTWPLGSNRCLRSYPCEGPRFEGRP